MVRRGGRRSAAPLCCCRVGYRSILIYTLYIHNVYILYVYHGVVRSDQIDFYNNIKYAVVHRHRVHTLYIKPCARFTVRGYNITLPTVYIDSPPAAADSVVYDTARL